MDSDPRNWSLAVRDARRELLLDAARTEFGEKGLEGATMRAIASRARCTTGAIYPLFESKEAIYAALLENSLARLDARVAAAMAVARPPRERLAAGCQAFVDHYLAHRFEVNLGLYAFRGLKRQGVGGVRDQDLNRALLAVLDRLGAVLAEARGVDRDAVRPLVALLFSQMIGALVLQLAGRLDMLDVDAGGLVTLLLAQLDGTQGGGRRGRNTTTGASTGPAPRRGPDTGSSRPPGKRRNRN